MVGKNVDECHGIESVKNHQTAKKSCWTNTSFTFLATNHCFLFSEILIARYRTSKGLRKLKKKSSFLNTNSISGFFFFVSGVLLYFKFKTSWVFPRVFLSIGTIIFIHSIHVPACHVFFQKRSSKIRAFCPVSWVVSTQPRYFRVTKNPSRFFVYRVKPFPAPPVLVEEMESAFHPGGGDGLTDRPTKFVVPKTHGEGWWRPGIRWFHQWATKKPRGSWLVGLYTGLYYLP